MLRRIPLTRRDPLPVASHARTPAGADLGAELLPLDELLQVTHGSSLFNEGDRRSIFYAQSWALTHLILLGEPNRSAELGMYVALVSEGVPPMDAWRRAFGTVDMERQLQQYIRRDTFRAMQFTFPEKLAAFEGAAVPVPDPDAQAFLADFLVQQRRVDEAAERLQAAAAQAPDNARVKIVMALLGIARREHRTAEERLLGLGEISDWLIGYLGGTAIAELLEDLGASPGKAHLEAARRLFSRATARPRRSLGEGGSAVDRYASAQSGPAKQIPVGVPDDAPSDHGPRTTRLRALNRDAATAGKRATDHGKYQRPVNFGFLFSRNADVPSCLSSDE